MLKLFFMFCLVRNVSNMVGEMMTECRGGGGDFYYPVSLDCKKTA